MQNDFIEELLRLAGLGAIGGIARYLQLTYLQTKIFEWGAFLATTIVGAVCGIALGWMVGSIYPNWQNVSAIVSGVIGLQLVYVLASIVSKITGKQFGIEITEIEMKNDIKVAVLEKRQRQIKRTKDKDKEKEE